MAERAKLYLLLVGFLELLEKTPEQLSHRGIPIVGIVMS